MYWKHELKFESPTQSLNALSDTILGCRKFSSSIPMLKKIEEFVVIGGGLMGAGIAQVKIYILK